MHPSKKICADPLPSVCELSGGRQHTHTLYSLPPRRPILQLKIDIYTQAWFPETSQLSDNITAGYTLAHIDLERSLPLVSSVYTSIHPSILPVFLRRGVIKFQVVTSPQPEAMKGEGRRRLTYVQLSHMLSSNLCVRNMCYVSASVSDWQSRSGYSPLGSLSIHKEGVKTPDACWSSCVKWAVLQICCNC